MYSANDKMRALITLGAATFFTMGLPAQGARQTPAPADAPIAQFGLETSLGEMTHLARVAHIQELVGSASKLLKQLHKKAADAERIENFVLEHTKKRLDKSRWSSQSGAVAQTILEESRRYEFDPLFLLAVIENESSFNPAAHGSHGEIGLMQLLPGTAQWVTGKLALEWKGTRSLLDLRQNIRIGAAYLDYLRKKFQWNGTLYLAAYNMGSANVARRISQKVTPKVYPQRVLKRYLKLYATM